MTGLAISPFSRLLKQPASFVLASLRPSTWRMNSSEVGSNVEAYPFAKIHCKGERPTRSAVGTSSGLLSLRPCWTDCLSSLRECTPQGGLAQPAFGFRSRRGREGIVGPGVFGVAATEFFFHFEIGRLPEAGEVLRDLDRPACR
jgi:hypothetical protein